MVWRQCLVVIEVIAHGNKGSTINDSLCFSMDCMEGLLGQNLVVDDGLHNSLHSNMSNSSGLRRKYFSKISTNRGCWSVLTTANKCYDQTTRAKDNRSVLKRLGQVISVRSALGWLIRDGRDWDREWGMMGEYMVWDTSITEWYVYPRDVCCVSPHTYSLVI